MKASEHEGAIAGVPQVERFPSQGIHHVATLSIGAHPSRHGMGIGRAPMNFFSIGPNLLII